MLKHYLYRHLNKFNLTPFYIGIGTKQKRGYYDISSEFERAYTDYCRNSIWHNIANKYGYIVEIVIESNNYDFIKKKEKELISLYGRINNNTGILANLTNGGDGLCGWKPTKEARKNMRLSHLGKCIPKETRIKMSKSRKKYLRQNPEKMRGKNHPNYGKEMSEETKEKIGSSQSGEKHHFYGMSHSEETKKKMSISHIGVNHTDEAKEKISKALSKSVMNIETGEAYNSLTLASEITGKTISNISMHCNNKYKKQKFKFI
jgi:hypothetical protein